MADELDPATKELYTAAAGFVAEAVKFHALVEIVKVLPNGKNKVQLLNEFTKRLASANKAFAASLEGYASCEE